MSLFYHKSSISNDYRYNLKQGVGRLVRDVNDSGVIIICDKRLVSRPYGEIFLNILNKLQDARQGHARGLLSVPSAG